MSADYVIEPLHLGTWAVHPWMVPLFSNLRNPPPSITRHGCSSAAIFFRHSCLDYLIYYSSYFSRILREIWDIFMYCSDLGPFSMLHQVDHENHGFA